MEVKEKVITGYKYTELGVIPNDWNVMKIGPLIDLLTGFPFPSSQYSEYGIRLLKGSNVKRGVTDWSEYITSYWAINSPSLKPYELRDEDLVIAMDGSLVGRSYAMLSKNDLPALLLQRVARIRSRNLEVKFLKFFIGSDWFIKYCDSVKTVTAIPHISPKDIKEFSIPLPPTLAEQRAIATALSDVDALISSLDKLIAKKKAIKQGAMQELLTGRKRLEGFGEGMGYKETDVGRIPEDWEVNNLGEIVNIVGGGTPSTFNSSFWNGEINWFTPTEVGHKKYLIESNRKISDLGYSNSSAQMLPIGTILLTSRAGIGDLGILLNEACTNQGFQSLIPKANINNEYIYYLVSTLKKELIQNSSGSTFLEISPGKIRAIKVCLPDKLEQDRIAKVLSNMDLELSTLNNKKAKTQALKQGIMQELLTGKTRLV